MHDPRAWPAGRSLMQTKTNRSGIPARATTSCPAARDVSLRDVQGVDVADRQDTVIRRILGYSRRIAVVGLADEPWRASHGVAAELAARGYEIVPVNPTIPSALGLPSYPTLADVPGEIDLVDVFRRPEFLP